MTLDNHQAKITEDIRWWAKITNATNYMSIIDKDQPNHPSTSESEAKIPGQFLVPGFIKTETSPDHE